VLFHELSADEVIDGEHTPRGLVGDCVRHVWDPLIRRSWALFRAKSSGSGPEAGLIASSGIVVAGRLEDPADQLPGTKDKGKGHRVSI
jgi:hypothetical protein